MKRYPREFAKPGTWQILKEVSRCMRVAPTPAEDALWQRLRGSQLGVRFRRQHAIDRFVVDFVCLNARLIVEVDGSVHDDRQGEDAARERVLHSLGYCVLRFTNDQVQKEPDGVVSRIVAALQETA
jgi:very-short-patch-repair endonuclease